jgi:hypothetical protein
LTRIFVDTVQSFYGQRAASRGARGGKTGAVTVVQRTSSDLRLNPHLHVLLLDGTYHEQGGELVWRELGRLSTPEVGEVLERAVRRMERYLRGRGLLDPAGESDEQGTPADALCASAVSGQTPPSGPQWVRGLSPPVPSALGYDKVLCAALDGFTLHAATRAGGADVRGREALLRYVLRPPLAQERIAFKRAYADGTVAVDMDPLSLLCRLAASVPPPRYHTVKYAGVLASASRVRARIAPLPSPSVPVVPDPDQAPLPKRSGSYWPWAELLKRTFGIDILVCPNCQRRMKLTALVTEPKNITRFLAALGEPTDLPARSPSRGPPYWRSTVLRRKALADVA